VLHLYVYDISSLRVKVRVQLYFYSGDQISFSTCPSLRTSEYERLFWGHRKKTSGQCGGRWL